MVGIADTSTSKLSSVEEVTRGTTPASPNLKEVRRTGDEFSENISTTTSAEISSARTIADAIPTSSEVGGPLNYEASFIEHEPFMESHLQNVFSVAIDTTETDISFTASDESINDASNNFPIGDLSVGQVLFVSGAANSENNGQFYIATVAAGKITFAAKREETLGIVDESAGASVRYQAERLVNGSTRKTFTFEREFTSSGAYNFFIFRGMEANTMELSWEVQSILGGSFGFLGMSADQVTATLAGSTSPVTNNPLMNAMNNVGEIRENGTILGNVQSLSVSSTNNLSTIPVLGSFDAADIANGVLEPTGTAAIYFEGQDLALRTKNLQYSSFDIDAVDSDGNVYVVTFPKVRLLNAPVPASANNEPVIMNVEWAAVRDDNGVAMQIDKKVA